MEFIAIYAIYTTYTIIRNLHCYFSACMMIIIIPHVRATPIFISGISVMAVVTEGPLNQLAVCVRKACKSYGSLEVLRDLDMNVPSGNM